MTPQEYIDEHKVKPLTPSEIKRGKNALCIYGTDDPMPWDEIYTRIAAGMEMGHIAHVYGHGRKIALWAIKDKVELNPVISETLDSEIEQRRKMQQIEEISPTAAATIQEMANEYAPDAAKNVTMLANKLINAGSKFLDRKDKDGKAIHGSLDLVNISKALITSTDVLGLTQRHAAGSSMQVGEMKVAGFTFALDMPKKENEWDGDQLAIIDADVLPIEHGETT